MVGIDRAFKFLRLKLIGVNLSLPLLRQILGYRRWWFGRKELRNKVEAHDECDCEYQGEKDTATISTLEFGVTHDN